VLDNVPVGFFFHVQRNVEFKKLIQKRFSQVFFTDDEKYIKKFGFQEKNNNSLAIVFPSFKEIPLREIVPLLPGTACLVQGNYAEAMEEFDRLSSLSFYFYPEEIIKIVKESAILQKAVIYTRAKKYERAINMYTELLSLIRGDKELEIIAHYNLGSIYKKIGLMERAKEEFEIALGLLQQIDPLERRRIIRNSHLLFLFHRL
jgi:tetratricopeptide (TPR) repeat protein